MNLSARHAALRSSSRTGLRWRTCSICGAEFMGWPSASFCSEPCRKLRKRQRNRARDATRAEYFRQYHIEHRAERNAKRLAHFHKNKERIKAQRKAYRKANALVLKFADCWQVPVPVARRLMIEQGVLP